MIRYLYADQLAHHPRLAESMFRDRAEQFRNRLKWDVSVDDEGWELDEYDRVNPLYLIWERADGLHGASMRVLPTIGRTMVNEHFTHLNEGIRITGPFIWECTRFCIAPQPGASANHLAGALMLAGQELGLRFGLQNSVGVYDMRMTGIYRRIGWVPELVGYRGEGREKVCLGLWPFGEEIRDKIAANAGLPANAAEAWFDASFPAETAKLSA